MDCALTVVSERAVRCDFDVVLVAERDELVLGKQRVRFNLVDSLTTA